MTRHFWPSMLLACALAACTPATDTDERNQRKSSTYDAATFHETTTIFGASFSADESQLLMSSDQTGIFNVYAQPFGGGASKQLTRSTSDAHFAVSWFPEDDRFLFRADEGGDELDHLFVQDADGNVTDLTPGENLKASFAGWSKDKKSFWVETNERDPKFFDVYRYSTSDYERSLVFQNEGGWEPGAVSDDGRWLALGQVIDNADANILVADLEAPGAAPKLITEHEGAVAHRPIGFGPENQKLYYLTDGHGEFMQAWSYDLESGDHQPVVESDWDVMYVYFSEQGRYRVTALNQDAQTVLSILDAEIGEDLALPDLPGGDVTGVQISRSEERMAFYVNSDTSPSNLYAFDIATNERRSLTNTLNPAIDQADLVEGEVVRYASFDGLKIPSVLYRPHQASSSTPVPAMVWVHGGPGGQSRKGYRATIQHLVNHGYAVLAVNNRGSSGYGKTFYHMDDKKHGEVDLQDVVWARKHLEGLDWVDGGKVGIIGGSYGGYMVAAALAFEPEVFDVGVDIFGVTNWVRTIKSIPPWWTAQKDRLYAELGNPYEEEERLRRISPLFHAGNITKPLLVIQGANDPRVLQVESDELVAAVEAKGVPVEYVIFPDEGHGFDNKANRITASDRYVAFLDKYLKGEGEGNEASATATE